MAKPLVAIAQLTALSTPALTLPHILPLLPLAASRKARILFLPEASDYISPTPAAAAAALAFPLTRGANPFLDALRSGAKEHKIWINVGIHERCDSDPKKCYNTLVLLDDEGEVRSTYRKIHLFDVDLEARGGPKILESNATAAGEEIVRPVETPAGILGLQICYDMRFATPPTLLYPPPHILVYPSAFALTTGPAHWALLLRARAVESQCYVIASAQVGEHFKGRASYGHSLVVDPWGKIIAELPVHDPVNPTPPAQLTFAELDLDAVDKVRREMPLDASRRRAEPAYQQARKRWEETLAEQPADQSR